MKGKRLFSVLLTLVMLLGILPAVTPEASAAAPALAINGGTPA